MSTSREQVGNAMDPPDDGSAPDGVTDHGGRTGACGPGHHQHSSPSDGLGGDAAVDLDTGGDFDTALSDVLDMIATRCAVSRSCFVAAVAHRAGNPTATVSCVSNEACDYHHDKTTAECPLVEALSAGRTEVGAGDDGNGDTGRAWIIADSTGDFTSGIGLWSEDRDAATPGDCRSLKALAHILGFVWDRVRLKDEQTEIERRAIGTLKMAERAAYLASLGSLVSGVSHEISQPLTALKLTVDGMLYWREHGHVITNDELFDNLRFISEQSERMDLIIRNMRALAQQERGGATEPVAMADVVGDALGLLGQQTRSHGIRIAMADGGLAGTVESVRAQVQQAIAGLMVNAIQRLDRTDRTDKCMTISTTVTDERCMVHVEDNGFAPGATYMRQVNDSTAIAVDADEPGVGLFVARNIAATMNGIVRMDMAATGVRFTLELPGGSTDSADENHPHDQDVV